MSSHEYNGKPSYRRGLSTSCLRCCHSEREQGGLVNRITYFCPFDSSVVHSPFKRCLFIIIITTVIVNKFKCLHLMQTMLTPSKLRIYLNCFGHTTKARKINEMYFCIECNISLVFSFKYWATIPVSNAVSSMFLMPSKGQDRLTVFRYCET